ncbi:hypothetical protein GZ77_14545 [Endozoicomonas montiporae]|uniref:MASE2 domain-containing protein n=2 Tax=Endozoicomonas montiporae TaxID=1027273 RepID=A0A081N520_9GAMM|nr:MASE2 domain-containing protein [Endozoicomonas montiporae]AMO57580.1 hypothetical protein EZMO1_3600 [Endozoicomonas montiporae CL-33]KEQ13543.1 hypothetical protein GZ77_14545 [Endozoicomonas montiporae]
MSENTTGSLLRQPVCRNYPLRFLSYSLVGLAIAFGMYLGSIPEDRFIFVVYCIAYPHVATLVLFFLKRYTNRNALMLSHMADALNLGALLTISCLPLLETPLFVTMLISTGLIRFGTRSLLYSVPSILAAIGLIHYLYQPKPWSCPRK